MKSNRAKSVDPETTPGNPKEEDRASGIPMSAHPASHQPRMGLPVQGTSFALLHLTLLLYSVGSIFAKYAALHWAGQTEGLSLLFLGLEFLTLLVYTLLWQQVLRRMPLSFAYSNKAVCTLWTCLFGFLLFGEALTLGKAAGIAVVLAGVWLVVTDRDR